MTTRQPKLDVDVLLLAGDEIVINVDHSYRAVVPKAVQIYLEQAIGLEPSSETLLTPEDVVFLQKKGRFTSYWDLTTAFVLYFIEMLPPVPVPTFPARFHIPGLMAYLQAAGGNLGIGVDTLRQQRDIARLAAEVAAAGGGLDATHKILPQENRHLLVSSGEITKMNVLARIFQELYLGTDLFEEIYEQPAFVVQNEGYYQHETCAIEPEILADLSRQLPLAVVSNRPRREVEQSLHAQKIDAYFSTVVALETIEQAKAKPVPDAWPLLEAVRQLDDSAGRCAYVGANVGDVQAAKAAEERVPFTAIGCLINAPDTAAMRQDLETAGADIVLEHPNHLKELILG